MGYDLYILIQSLSEDKELKDLYYHHFSGSYSATDNHYLYSKLHHGKKEKYVGLKKMGECQFLISYQELLDDYHRYCDPEHLDDEYNEYNVYNDFWKDELKSYYELCKKFINEGHNINGILVGIIY